jgi:uncharacterized tellurite resistance protein B-like protein
MLESIRKFYDRHIAPEPPEEPGTETVEDVEHNRLALAAAALLLELAHADGCFSDEEQAHLVYTLTHHFRLEPSEAQELIGLAEVERRKAVDLYQFTSLVTASYDEGQRLLLAEVMWRLVYADGELARHEEYLMQRLSGLLELRPGYLAEARKRAVETGPPGID